MAIAEGSHSLTMNQIKSPNYWVKDYPDVLSKRLAGYQKLEHLIKSGRLVVKDSNHGSTLAYAETLIQYYKEKYPTRRLVYMLDNFHKLNDFSDQKDERTRFKKLSNAIKGLATTYHIPILSTVEYTKLPAGTKPSNTSISETVAMEYDSNLIIHLYNELHELGPNANMFHITTNKEGQIQRLPRIEMIFGKNKITSFKSSLWYDFYPASSDFVGVDETVIAAQLTAMEAQKENQSHKQHKIDPSKGMYS